MENLLVFLAVVGAIIYFVKYGNDKREDEQKRLYQAYQDALRSGNKGAALSAGRAYYSNLRKGKLTIYDEQAITNDLSAM